MANDVSAELTKHGFTTELIVGSSKVHSGYELPITAKWQALGTYLLVLSNPEDRSEGQFLIAALLGPEHRYVVLSYSQDIAQDWDVPPRVVLKVSHETSLSVLSPSELQALAGACLASLTAAPPDGALLSTTFGAFTTASM